jgi:hypothetical protein
VAKKQVENAHQGICWDGCTVLAASNLSRMHEIVTHVEGLANAIC